MHILNKLFNASTNYMPSVQPPITTAQSKETNLNTQTKKSALVKTNNNLENLDPSNLNLKKLRKYRARFTNSVNNNFPSVYTNQANEDENNLVIKMAHDQMLHFDAQTQTDANFISNNCPKEISLPSNQMACTKLRSRSLTPSKLIQDGVDLNYPPCLDRANTYYSCFPTNPTCTQCLNSNIKIRLGKHEKHPEDCKMCKQHLNNLIYKNQTPDRNSITSHCILPSNIFSNQNKIPCQPDQNGLIIQNKWKKGFLKNSYNSTHPFYHQIQAQSNFCNYQHQPTQQGIIKNFKHPDNYLEFYHSSTYLIMLIKGMETEVDGIRLAIKSFLSRIDRKDTENIIIQEWRMFAIVMDRIFFICYLIIHICAAFGLLIPRPPDYTVAQFLNEYRLKNYNASYIEKGSNLTNSAQIENVQSVDQKWNRDKLMTYTNYPKVSIPKQLDDSNPQTLEQPLSPYQRLVDQTKLKNKYDHQLDKNDDYELNHQKRKRQQQQYQSQNYLIQSNWKNPKKKVLN